jgi:hypothetical protein
MLRAIQLAFLERITGGEAGRPVLGLVNGDCRLDAEGRLKLYAEAYVARLRETLEETYPALAAALGEDAFDELARSYVAAHPSRQPLLRAFGGELPGHLRKIGGPAWHADLAALEWARCNAFDGPNPPLVVNMRTVAALGPSAIGTLRLKLIEAQHLVFVEHAVEMAWTDALDGHAVVAPRRAPGLLFVWRRGLEVFHRRVDEVESGLLGAAVTGLSFAELCDRLARDFDEEEAPRRAGALLGRWIGDGLLFDEPAASTAAPASPATR